MVKHADVARGISVRLRARTPNNLYLKSENPTQEGKLMT